MAIDPTDVTILSSASIAIIGWIYTARRQRLAARKQHTFNALLHVSFQKECKDALGFLVPYIREDKKLPKPERFDEELKSHARFILNHYEFVAAGVRNGDIDEKLLRDSERGTVVGLAKAFEPFIYHIRRDRNRDSIYEHLEWLRSRWGNLPPKKLQRMVEFVIARPLYGKRRNH